MLDDGEVERRVRLIRPMERLNFVLTHLTETHWEEVDERTFGAVWQDEVAQVDEFTTSELHIVTGLLLPIWKQLPEESTRVYRLQADDGTRIVGRKVSAAWAASATANSNAPVLSPPQAIALLREGQAMLDLPDGLQLRRSRLMQVNRIELTGFGSAAVDRLKAMGLFSEIVSWKLRLFVPDDIVTGSREHGLPYRQSRSSGDVSGVYRQRIQLASGRFAMIDDGLGFSLVPWSKQLDRHFGRYLSGQPRPGGGIEWTLGRSRSIEI